MLSSILQQTFQKLLVINLTTQTLLKILKLTIQVKKSRLFDLNFTNLRKQQSYRPLKVIEKSLNAVMKLTGYN